MSADVPVDPQGNPIGDDVVGGPPPVRGRHELAERQSQAELSALATARSFEHDPHPFGRVVGQSSTACRRCGAGVTVVMRDGGPSGYVAEVNGALIERRCAG